MTLEIEIDKRMPILVVEDSPNLRKILVMIVKKLGFEDIREADNGQNAWVTLNQAPVGLVITDLDMPIVDGFQLIRLIRNNNKYDSIPILVISAADRQEIIIKAAKSGVDGYIIKPFEVDQVAKKIKDAYAHRAQVHPTSP